ncbi:Uncharacterised protein [Bordetella pertussis]|nr:Uncharacterised protein [Bordetella pertussis]
MVPIIAHRHDSMLQGIHGAGGDGSMSICRAGGLALDYRVLLRCNLAARRPRAAFSRPSFCRPLGFPS